MHERINTEADDLIQHIRGLREAIDQDWRDLDCLALTDNERTRIRDHIRYCTKDLADLLARMDEIEEASLT